MRNTIWISYDLGVQGDYEGLYTWLDQHQAKECGDSLASLVYEYSGELLAELIQDIKNSVKLERNSRVYVVYRGEQGLIKGKFIVGGIRTTVRA